MNNFFFDEADYSLFKKALKTTDNEPIVINILSTDSSLQSREEKTAEVVSARKNMSKKYEPSPFGKFFGPRKQQTAPVDMKDFSSWKNKNYRKTEKTLDEQVNSTVKFSMADFMNDKSDSMFNELDQAKSELQKPINQLSSSDPLYKRFSLDSYMNKLEEQTLTKDSFEKNDDILEPLGTDTELVVPDSSQDENFGLGSNINIEKFAFDDDTSGDEFKFEQEELDKFRARLDKIEREAANIKEKTNQKVIEKNDLNELGGFDIDSLTDDTENDLDETQTSVASSKIEDNSNSNSEAPKVKHKTFFEVNKNEGASKKRARSGLISAFDGDDDQDSLQDNLDDENNDFDLAEEMPQESNSTEDENDTLSTLTDFAEDEDQTQENVEDTELLEQTEKSVIGKNASAVKRSDIVTKDDLKSMTDELLTKFAQMSKKDGQTDMLSMGGQYVDGYQQDYIDGQDMMYDTTDPAYTGQMPYATDNNLQAQLNELIASNRKMDLEHSQRLKEAEIEKERVAAEYESRIKDMEQSFKQSYEDFKKQAYLDKLDRDIKLKEAENKFKKKTAKIKEEEKDTYSKEKTGAMLRKELKSNLNISNLEMDKKLLEVASKYNKDSYDKLFAENTEMVRRLEEESMKAQEEEFEEPETEELESVEETEEVVEEPEKKETKTVKKPAPRKRKSTRKTTTVKKTTRRKIDSDIIGGIDFD